MNEGMLIRGPQHGGVGTFTPPTAGRTGAQRVQQAHGRYLDAALDGRTYYAANQVATAWSVALATTYTGLVLSNPRGSKVYLAPLLAGFALSVAPAAIAPMSFFGGFDPAGVTTHTTPLVPLGTSLDQDQAAGDGKADAAATLVGTPRWLLPFLGGFTAAALPATSPSLLDIGGLFLIPPGAYFGIGALTAVTGFASLVWEELPIVGWP